MQIHARSDIHGCSGVIPALTVDAGKNEYYRVTEGGLIPVLPYGEE